MTHLYIELNTGLTEEVNSSIISKLYELAISGDLDSTSDLKGRLHSSTAKEKHVTYLNNNFDDLYISADTQYISFEDPDVEEYMKRYIGNSDGVTLQDVLTFISSNSLFGSTYYNTHTNTYNTFTTSTAERLAIQSFDEIALFLGISGIQGNTISGSAITSFQIPSSVTTLYNGTFHGCANLTSVEGLSNIQYLHDQVFYNCENLLFGDLSLPNLVLIGGEVFRQTYGLTKISLPDGVTFTGNNTFYKCINMTEANIGNNVIILSGAHSMFAQCSSLLKVTGLSGLTKIPSYMFTDCSSLSISNIDIDFSLITSIDLYAFNNCTSLLIGQLSVPNMTFLGQFAFRNTKVLTVTNLGSITTLQPQVFRGCSSLTSVTLPATITEIRNHAFCDCTNLTTINIPSTCTSIYNNAFEACSNLDVTLDLSNVTDIGAQAFKDCTKLKISNLPKASNYPSQLFLAAKGLTNVVIPKEVVTIGSSCFNQCTNIQTVTFELNSQLDDIKDNAFNSCSSLLTLIIPEGCTKIGGSAFLSSGITLLDIPSTVTEIGSTAFRNLPLSATIIFRCDVPTFGSTSDIFAYSSYDLQLSTVSIYVPDDLVAAYKAVPCLSNVINHIYGISQMPNS